MRKLLTAAALALVLAAATGHRASAWSNGKFSIGMNLEWNKGDNCFLWGAYRNGPAPDPYGGPGWSSLPPSHHGYYAGSYAPAPVAGYPMPGNSALAGYPSYYPNSYYPASYFQLATYPSAYPAGYYPMSYQPGYAYPPSAINFYGN
jgi:hypothetical protein